jgi:hypothetical protein
VIDQDLPTRPDGSLQVIYVGKTRQTLQERFRQHLDSKPQWEGRRLNIEPEREGQWTNFLTAVWENHEIEVYREETRNLKTIPSRFRKILLPG